MTRTALAAEVLDDFERFFDYQAQFDPATGSARVAEILQAIRILSHSPMIGRPVRAGKRELVIGRGTHGYVALYRYDPVFDTAFVLALRAQREQGCKR